MGSKLKPCPFCGCENIEFEVGFSYKDNGKVCHAVCQKCFASCNGAKTKQTAINRWNKRAT